MAVSAMAVDPSQYIQATHEKLKHTPQTISPKAPTNERRPDRRWGFKTDQKSYQCTEYSAYIVIANKPGEIYSHT